MGNDARGGKLGPAWYDGGCPCARRTVAWGTVARRAVAWRAVALVLHAVGEPTIGAGGVWVRERRGRFWLLCAARALCMNGRGRLWRARTLLLLLLRLHHAHVPVVVVCGGRRQHTRWWQSPLHWHLHERTRRKRSWRHILSELCNIALGRRLVLRVGWEDLSGGDTNCDTAVLNRFALRGLEGLTNGQRTGTKGSGISAHLCAFLTGGGLLLIVRGVRLRNGLVWSVMVPGKPKRVRFIELVDTIEVPRDSRRARVLAAFALRYRRGHRTVRGSCNRDR